MDRIWRAGGQPAALALLAIQPTRPECIAATVTLDGSRAPHPALRTFLRDSAKPSAASCC